MSKHKDFSHLVGKWIRRLAYNCNVDLFTPEKYYLVTDVNYYESGNGASIGVTSNRGHAWSAVKNNRWDLDSPLDYNPNDVKFPPIKESENMEQEYQDITLANLGATLRHNNAVIGISDQWNNYYIFKSYSICWNEKGSIHVGTSISIAQHEFPSFLAAFENKFGKLKRLPKEKLFDAAEYLQQNGFKPIGSIYYRGLLHLIIGSNAMYVTHGYGKNIPKTKEFCDKLIKLAEESEKLSCN